MGLPPSHRSALPLMVRSRVPARGGSGLLVCTITGSLLAAAAASGAFQDLCVSRREVGRIPGFCVVEFTDRDRRPSSALG